MENCSGKKIFLKFDTAIEESLSFEEHARCRLYNEKIIGFKRILGANLFLDESTYLFNLAVRDKDPMLFAN